MSAMIGAGWPELVTGASSGSESSGAIGPVNASGCDVIHCRTCAGAATGSISTSSQHAIVPDSGSARRIPRDGNKTIPPIKALAARCPPASRFRYL
jgi:hypothetical protein